MKSNNLVIITTSPFQKEYQQALSGLMIERITFK